MWRPVAVTLVVPVLLLAPACSRSPEEKACGARDNLISQVDVVAGHVQAANFGAAADSLPDVLRALVELVVALDEVGGEVQADLKAYLVRVEAQVEVLDALPPNPIVAFEAIRQLLDEGARLLEGVARDLGCR